MLFSILLVAFFAFGSNVYSQRSNSAAYQNKTNLGNATASANSTEGGRLGQFVNNKLQGIKLQICERLSRNISKRSQQLVQKAQNMEMIFDRHATAVENYYTGTLVPQGKTVPNYNALVTAIQTDKANVDSFVMPSASSSASFSCNSDNPLAQLEQFRQNMLSVIQALNTYKKSVVNLIVSVAKVAGVGTGNPNASGSSRLVPTGTAGGSK